jgi:16S rRNA (cytosine1402-N4)-methyltransferase
MIHTPVMTAETVEHLLHDRARLIFDGTVGAGGHAAAVLEASVDVRVVGVDCDPDALGEAQRALERFGERVVLVRDNYAEVDRILRRYGKADGALVDLGVSSLQIDRAQRGFSYSKDGPLDMQMSKQGRSARVLLEESSDLEMTQILETYGEISGARRIARSIRRAVEQGEMKSTQDLRKAVDSAMHGRAAPSVLSKVFQAVRIAVNDEIENLRRFLNSVGRNLEKDARIVVISYHSLEDRVVKDFFRRESTDCICPPASPVCTCGHRATLHTLTRRVVRPRREEIELNPRARSARLRAARVL